MPVQSTTDEPEKTGGRNFRRGPGKSGGKKTAKKGKAIAEGDKLRLGKNLGRVQKNRTGRCVSTRKGEETQVRLG